MKYEKNENCRLSVGIPTYNQAVYLEETILSLLNQKIPPYEIVVSNNHSTDETQEILKKFEGRVRVIRPPVHLEMMAHWNFLVSNLRGEWFSILSSDDLALPNFVEVLCRGISRSENAVLIRSGYETIDGEGNFLEKHYILSARRVTKPPRTLLEQLDGPKTNFAAFAVKKDAWKKVSGFPEECTLFGDWGLWIKISPLGNFVYEHDIISKYRSSYRPELEKTRILKEIKDEINLYSKIIPKSAKQVGGIDNKKIKHAMRKRFHKKIARMSQLGFSSDERSQILKTIYPWAKAVDGENLLSVFRAGGMINYDSIMNKFRRIARKIYYFLDRALY